MTIDEAIEILEREERDAFWGSEKKWKGAVKLSIEALKRIQNARAIGYSVPASLLPGETEEGKGG